MHRWGLLDVTDERLQRGGHTRGVEAAGVIPRCDHPLGVESVAALAEPHHTVVGLGLGVKVVDEPGGPADGFVSATDGLRQMVFGSDEVLQRYRLRASGVGALAAGSSPGGTAG